MADVEELCQDGYRFATQAIACDQKGSIDSAIFFYIEAASSLERALSYDNTLDVREKALQYVQRAEVLRLQSKSQQQQHGPLKTSQQNNLEKAEFLLKQGLHEDEKGKHDEALPLYTDAVQLCLDFSKSLSDNDPLKAQFNNLAKKALERAEDIKKMQSSGTKSSGQNETPSVTRGVASMNLTDDSFTTPKGSQGKGKPKYTPEELAVLKTTSKINGKLYLPWNDIDLKERFAYPVCFTDKDGPLALSPKQKNNFDKWVRPTDIYENPEMIYAISSFSVKQTIVSDCSFISSLAISAAYERNFKKRLITSIIYPQNRDGKPMINPSGKYMIKLWLNGTARKVIIDDTLPMGRDDSLLCSHSTNRNEMWISLIEKAYMKVMGGYDFPGSNSSIDLHALTGWIPERMSVKRNSSDFNEALQFDRLLTGLRRGDCLITVATGPMSDSDAERAGLVPTHAYAVLDMRKVMSILHLDDGVDFTYNVWNEISNEQNPKVKLFIHPVDVAVIDFAKLKGHRLLLLKNPWSHMRWKGKFSERDESSWTPELERALNYDRKSALQHDNGVFWIAWETLLHFYDVIYLNWNPKLFAHRFTFHGTWEAKEGPVKDAYNIGNNPQYRLEVNTGAQSAVVWILLTRHITRKEDFAENKEFITVHVYKTDGKRVYYPDNPYQEGTKINSPFYLSKLNVPAGKQRFTLIISQYEKTNTIHYTLKVFSSCEFRLSPVVDPYKHEKTVKDSWTAKTAGGCPNYPTFTINPVYSLELKSPVTSNPAEVFIKMLAPKQYSIGVMLRSVDRTSSGKPVYEAPFESYRPGFYVMQLSGVPAGSYQLIPSTFLPKQEGPFILTVAASCNLSLTKL